MAGFIAVHCGAGFHSKEKSNAYKSLCKEACKEAIDRYETSKDALIAVTMAVRVLENSPLTNAGYGSNLTWDGKVECDASIMNGSTLQFGACGAVTCIRNPVDLASIICRRQGEKLALGRTPPCLLVGAGAEKWAMLAGIPQVSPQTLISDEAKVRFKQQKNKQSLYESVLGSDINALDTVGAIFVDEKGYSTAACSSGGISLKSSGRIGQAASFASGCWAEISNNTSYATCTTGCGEQLIKTLLAKQAVDDLKDWQCPTTSLHNTLHNGFIKSMMIQNDEEKNAGILALKYDIPDGTGEIIWGHTTSSLCIAYATTYPRTQFKSVMSRKNGEEETVIGGTSFILKKVAEVDSENSEEYL